MKLLRVVILLLVVFSFSTSLMAEPRRGDGPRGDKRRRSEEKIELKMGGKPYLNNGVIYLARLIKNIRPRIDLDKVRLVKVSFAAKSKQGQGTAYLQVGQEKTRPEMFGGSLHMWDSNKRDTYDKKVFYNPDPRADQGAAWQIHMRGSFKVQRVTVWIEKKRPFEVVSIEAKRGPRYSVQGEKQIYLKQDIETERRDLDLAKYKIKRVEIYAKSKNGSGTAQLTIGQSRMPARTIPGDPRGFQADNNPDTYYLIEFEPDPSADPNGAWQIHLNGNIKIDAVDVILVRRGINKHDH